MSSDERGSSTATNQQSFVNSPRAGVDPFDTLLQTAPPPPPENTSRQRKRAKKACTATTHRRLHGGHVAIFCDLDGCLADFDSRVKLITGKFPAAWAREQDGLHQMWEAVKSDASFFEKLPWTADGQQLWQSLQSLQTQNPQTVEKPVILTGLPQFTETAAVEKKVR